MVIVQGTFRVDPSEREAYLAQSIEDMRSSRADPGCLEYVLAADPIEADRVVLSERWESTEHLDAHLDRVRRQRSEAGSSATAARPRSWDITVYEVASARPLG